MDDSENIVRVPHQNHPGRLKIDKEGVKPGAWEQQQEIWVEFSAKMIELWMNKDPE